MKTISIPTNPTEAATHGGTNAIVAVMLGVYLLIVVYQGNLGALATAAKQDFLGGANEPPFWRWAAALLILVALARNPKVNFVFGPLLVLALAGMAINVATVNTSMMKNLQAGIASFFGQGGSSIPAMASPQTGALAGQLASSTALPIGAGPSLGSASNLLGGTSLTNLTGASLPGSPSDTWDNSPIGGASVTDPWPID